MQEVLILRHGKLLCAAAYGAQMLDAPKYTFSACKSVTSLAIGLLMDDGLLYYVNLSVVDNHIVRMQIDANAVPEPSTWALLALGVAVLFLRKRS